MPDQYAFEKRNRQPLHIFRLFKHTPRRVPVYFRKTNLDYFELNLLTKLKLFYQYPLGLKERKKNVITKFGPTNQKYKPFISGHQQSYIKEIADHCIGCMLNISYLQSHKQSEQSDRIKGSIIFTRWNSWIGPGLRPIPRRCSLPQLISNGLIPPWYAAPHCQSLNLHVCS